MSRNLTPYVPEELKLDTSEQVLMGVQQRVQNKIVPSQGSQNYSYDGNNQIEFQWTHGDACDLSTTLLYFTVAFSGTTSANIRLRSASDIVDKVEFYIDNTEVFTSTNMNLSMVQNILMLSEFPKDYFEREGGVLMGWHSQNVNNSDYGTARTYGVPLWAYHVGFSQTKIFPVLGSNLRLVLHLARPEVVLSVRTHISDNKYSLNNVFLMEDRLILTPDYKQALMAQVKSAEGFKIHYTDFDITPQNITGAQNQTLVVRNEHSNAVTLILFNQYLDSFRADIANGANPLADPDVYQLKTCYPTLDTDLARRVANLKVECGSLRFTGLNGSSSPVEHFSHLERANGTLAKPHSVGCFTWPVYNTNLTQNLVGANIQRAKTVANNAGLNEFQNSAPLIVSLEKTMSSDIDVAIVNKGLSSTDPMASRDIEVYMQFGAGQELNQTRERLYSCLVYEKALVMKQGMIDKED
jgi:hypothetical protein